MKNLDNIINTEHNKKLVEDTDMNEVFKEMFGYNMFDKFCKDAENFIKEVKETKGR